MTGIRTFTLWFNLEIQGSLATISRDSTRAAEAERLARTLGHEFVESSDAATKTKKMRVFGYTAPITAASKVFANLKARDALSGNVAWIDNGLPQYVEDAFASVAEQYGLLYNYR